MPTRPQREQSIGIAGCGRVAQALGRLLADRGEPVTAVAGRNRSRTAEAAAFIGNCKPSTLPVLAERASRVIIAVPDRAIEEVAESLASSGMRSGSVLHTSGARGVEPLQALGRQGVSCGTLHPLQTVANPRQGVAALPGSAFAVGGQPDALDWALKIVALLEGQALNIAEQYRPLYHAAAVMAGNYVIATLDAAVALLAEAGIERGAALKALGPLAKASLANGLSEGPVEALTGPVERGDVATVRAHLSAMASRSGLESVESMYRAIGFHALHLATRGGLDREVTAELAALLAEGEKLHA